MHFDINDIITVTKSDSCCQKQGKYSISTDTRTIGEGQLYLPLKGENFDGHNFIQSALEKGCAGYFIEKEYFGKVKNLPTSKIVVVVENTLEAYLNLAKYYKDQVNPFTIAITGSCGKTTTKEMLYSAVSDSFKTHKSKLNYNNEVGLCQTMLSMPFDTKVLVLEMGMRGSGEIEILSKYSEPDIAIITNVGTAHIGRLGSVENIAKAKSEIVKYLKKNGLLIANDSEELKKVLDWLGKSIFYGAKDIDIKQMSENEMTFVYDQKLYSLNVAGEYNALNAIAAINAAKQLDVSDENILAGLKNMSQLESGGK